MGDFSGDLKFPPPRHLGKILQDGVGEEKTNKNLCDIQL